MQLRVDFQYQSSTAEGDSVLWMSVKQGNNDCSSDLQNYAGLLCWFIIYEGFCESEKSHFSHPYWQIFVLSNFFIYYVNFFHELSLDFTGKQDSKCYV